MDCQKYAREKRRMNEICLKMAEKRLSQSKGEKKTEKKSYVYLSISGRS